MKRIYILLCAVALTVGSLWAEEKTNIFDSGNRARFGMHLAWQLTSPSDNYFASGDELNNGSGLAIGATYSIPLWKNLYFEPGLDWFYNTMGYVPIVWVSNGVDNQYAVRGKGSVRNMGFSIPLNVGYRFNFGETVGFSVFTGPKINIGTSCKLKGNSPAISSIAETKYDQNLYDSGWHRIDLQWSFGIRCHYQDNWYAEISGAAGMTNLFSTKTWQGVPSVNDAVHQPNIRRNSFSIGVGYLF